VSEKTLDVVVIGSAIVDVISHAEDDFLAAHGMVKGSMQLIEDEVAHKLYADMPAAVESSGGSAANTAAGIASFGGSVAFIGKVANDQLGEVFVHDIRASGVQFDAPEVPDGPATARCLILVSPDAERTMNTFLGAASLITPDDINVDLVQSGRVVYCEGYLWDMPDAKAAIVTGMEAAAAAGGKVSFSLSDSFCVDRHRAEFLDLAERHVDILFANEDEICSLYETESFDEAAAKVAAHCEIACLTRGARGSVIVTADGHLTVPAAPVEKVIDTTGAGDYYAAGFLYAFTTGRGLEEGGRLASLAAGACIAHFGARPDVHLADLI
jgi:sugar/nucleoside kinase (ribokinase family)